MLNKISFRNYKSFKEWQELEIRPITVLIGKNSTGKSALTKLPTLIENSLSGNYPEALLLDNNSVELGEEFKDLIFGRTRIGALDLIIEDKQEKLELVIASETGSKDLPKIFSWKLTRNGHESIEKTEENSFKGFISQDSQEISKVNLSLNTEYIGPFRALPERSYGRPKVSKIEKVGVDGTEAYQLLIQDGLTTEQKVLNSVSDWYKAHFDGWGVRLNEEKDPFYQIELTREDPKLNINIKDVGQGMSQALPLVISAFMELTKETLIIIEQPELHLHPAAHGDLAELFVNAIARGKKRYLIETHSQNFVLRLRRLVAEKKFLSDNLLIYSVEFNSDNGTSSLKKINTDSLGDVDYWPQGVFSESLDEALAIRKAQKNNAV